MNTITTDRRVYKKAHENVKNALRLTNTETVWWIKNHIGMYEERLGNTPFLVYQNLKHWPTLEKLAGPYGQTLAKIMDIRRKLPDA